MIKVDIKEDRIGNIIGKPVRTDIQNRISAHMKEMTGHADKDFFLQQGMGAEEFKAEHLSPKKRREVERGWTETILMDPWEMAHYYGWDCHTLFE